MRRQNKQTAARHGLTLLEVIWSVFVVSMGLLGIIALFPVAGHQAKMGASADSMARLGNNAFRQFDVVGMGDPRVWNTVAPLSPDLPFPLPGRAYCMDPLHMAERISFHFPYGDGGTGLQNTSNPMQRITIRRATESDAQQNDVERARAYADLICRSDNDLVFNRPDDATLPPVQSYGSNDQPIRGRRQYAGHFSWFATMVPEINPQDLLDGYVNNPVERYRLSVVVCEQRPISSDAPAETEFVLSAQLPSNDQGAGSTQFVTLMAPTRELLEEVKKRQWIMLASRHIRPSGETVLLLDESPLNVYQWYRVDVVGKIVGNNGNYQRLVQLTGDEWPVLFQGPAVVDAIIVPSAIGVFERSIHLRSNELWVSPQVEDPNVVQPPTTTTP